MSTRISLHPSLTSKLRIVILECPYDTLHDPLVQETFGRLVHLKLKGYLKEYPYGVLPVDTSDFVADHLVLCETNAEGHLFPIMAQRSLSLRRCQIHGLHFPFAYLHESQFAHSRHAPFVASLLNRLGTSPETEERITYESSVTIAPHVRASPALRDLVRDLIWVQNARFHQERKTVASFALAVTRFKMDQAFQTVGFQIAEDAQGPLPSFFLPAGNEVAELRLMSREGPYPEALTPLLNFHQKLWDERLVLSARTLGILSEIETRENKELARRKVA